MDKENLIETDNFKGTNLTMIITEEDVIGIEDGLFELADHVVAAYERGCGSIDIIIDYDYLYWILHFSGENFPSQDTFGFTDKASFVEAYNNCMKDFTTKINKALTSFDALLEFLGGLDG